MSRSTKAYGKGFRAKYGTEPPKGKGDCFRASLDTATELLAKDPACRLFVVHGEPVGTGGEAEGIRYPHAWVEAEVGGGNSTGFVVIDRSNGKSFVVDRELYYSVGSIVHDDVRRYTAKEALSLAVKHGHYGPWEA